MANKIRRFMCDCETLDLLPTAALLQVAFVEMDFDKWQIVDEKQWFVDPDDCIRHGCTFSVDTLKFHLNSPDGYRAVKAAFNRSDDLPNTDKDKNFAWLPLGLLIPQISMALGNGDKEIWQLGTRDYEWLENAFRLSGCRNGDGSSPVLPPWKYWEWNDMRTLRNLLPHIKPPTSNERPHNALHDARHQAEHLMKLLKAFKDSNKPVPTIEDDEL